VTYVANLRAASAKARALNRILPELQDEFERALLSGQVLALGPGHFERVEEILAEELDAVVA
jgi:hypothetical protein